MQKLGTSDSQERIPGLISVKFPLLAPLVIYNMYLTTGLTSFRTPLEHPIPSGAFEREGLLLQCVQEPYLSSD